MKQYLTILFCTFGLHIVTVQRIVDISLTLGGSILTKNLLFVMSGIKLVDIACCNLHTRILELDPSEVNILIKIYLPQSRR